MSVGDFLKYPVAALSFLSSSPPCQLLEHQIIYSLDKVLLNNDRLVKLH